MIKGTPEVGRTLIQKLWQNHRIRSGSPDGATPDLLHVDLHLLHESSSLFAFSALREAGHAIRRPDLTLAVEDHNVPTEREASPTIEPAAQAQIDALRRNCAESSIPLFALGDAAQGIVHVVAPDLGLTQPGMLVACGDSHTATHGAMGALAFGIGVSEIAHVLATQALRLKLPKQMAVNIRNAGRELPSDVTAKDIALAMIAQIGAAGGQGYVVELRGSAVAALSMEGRMTLCNMAVETGARTAIVAPDAVTLAYLKGRKMAPEGAAWTRATQKWGDLASDYDATFDREITIDVDNLQPFVTWGIRPDQGGPISARVPDPASFPDANARQAAQSALAYMDLAPGTPFRNIPIDVVFIGSCANGRIEDLRAAAQVMRGHRIADRVRMLVVPGSMQVKAQAEAEGLDQVFLAAGAEWRNAGCSLCVALGNDVLAPGERCASTSNKNAENRQGDGGRTHLVSPAVAAATAVVGRLAAPADLV